VKVGDLIAFKKNPLHPSICECNRCLGVRGVVVNIDDSHRQTSLTILSSNGTIMEKIWDQHVEVFNECG